MEKTEMLKPRLLASKCASCLHSAQSKFSHVWYILVSGLLIITSPSHSDARSIIVLSSMNSVTIKIVDPSKYQPGTALSYRVTHHPDGAVLVEGVVPPEQVSTDRLGYPTFTLGNLSPRIWSPSDPQLYDIVVADQNGSIIGQTRFGFRSFEVKNCRFYLNGQPIFLRGLPINPPGRDLPESTGKDPEFARDYLRLLKEAGVNIARVESELWLSACDEVGMMVFQGQYGPAPGGTGHEPPAFDKCRDAYRRIFIELASHPSVVIYVLTNEVDYKNTSYKDLLQKVLEDVRQLDPTRPVIGNAGFGHGEPGEIYDVHCYYGWYAHNFQDWYRVYKTYSELAAKAGQPLTFTECVGAYTCDSGEFLSMSKQMSTRMRWIGTAEDPRQASLDYQAELLKQVVEIGRRMRTTNSCLAGIMPFTYPLGWANAHSVEDLIIKPAFHALKTVFQPVLISPECWKRNVYAGDEITVRLWVINDDDLGRDIRDVTAVLEVKSKQGKTLTSTRTTFPRVDYYSNAWQRVSVRIPENTNRGRYTVECTLIDKTGRKVSSNHFEITVAPRNWAWLDGVSISVYDPAGTTLKALKSLGARIKTIRSINRLPETELVIIGAKAFTKGSYPTRSEVARFLRNGGRILCLEQDPESWSSEWLPVKYNLVKSRFGFTYVHPVGRNNEIMDMLDASDLRFWNCVSESPDGTPDISPVLSPFKPASVDDLHCVRVWASCDRLLSSAVIIEVFEGSGSVILSQLRCVERVEHDPIAARLLANLIRYAMKANHTGLPSLDKPVQWNLEAFRTGIFVSNLQGLLPHSKTYQHTGSSKGKLGEDHSIDGFTLVGNYNFTANGWLQPVPDPESEGWGVFFGQLNREASWFVVVLQNTSRKPAAIRLRLDREKFSSPKTIAPGKEQEIRWPVKRHPGPVRIELRGNQDLVIKQTRFE